mmetsp:Transcript_155765/g.499292  ORF Transcript_155765/g.499292 Transcript_155765/m.499292 type:complete len:223 (-) Transcript_155765:1676-2344(-)
MSSNTLGLRTPRKNPMLPPAARIACSKMRSPIQAGDWYEKCTSAARSPSCDATVAAFCASCCMLTKTKEGDSGSESVEPQQGMRVKVAQAAEYPCEIGPSTSASSEQYARSTKCKPLAFARARMRAETGSKETMGAPRSNSLSKMCSTQTSEHSSRSTQCTPDASLPRPSKFSRQVVCTPHCIKANSASIHSTQASPSKPTLDEDFTSNSCCKPDANSSTLR